MTIFRYFRESDGLHSGTNAYLLALLSYYIYDHSDQSVVRNNHSENFRILCENLSNASAAERFRVRMYGGGPIVGTYPYDTEAALLNNDRVAIIVFRGTEGMPIPLVNSNLWSSIRDWLNNSQAFLFRPSTAWDGMVHRGFYQALNHVYEQIRADLNQIVADYPNIHIFLTGHSLGGSLATLCAYRLQRFDNDINISGVYTFGAPRVGNHRWAVNAYNGLPARHNALQDCTHRWVYNMDFGARVPFGGQGMNAWYHVGRLNYIDGNGNVARDRQPGDLLPPGAPSLGNHDMTRYCRYMFRELRTSEGANRDWLIPSDVEKLLGVL